MSFDVFDTNSDGKISELDLFKTFYQFSKSDLGEKFGDTLFKDIAMISKRISYHLEVKYNDIVRKNGQDQFFVKQYQDFRNLQRLDITALNKRKEKVLWPLFEFKRDDGPKAYNSV